jgi:hypothetical protein
MAIKVIWCQLWAQTGALWLIALVSLWTFFLYFGETLTEDRMESMRARVCANQSDSGEQFKELKARLDEAEAQLGYQRAWSSQVDKDFEALVHQIAAVGQELRDFKMEYARHAEQTLCGGCTEILDRVYKADRGLDASFRLLNDRVTKLEMRDKGGDVLRGGPLESSPLVNPCFISLASASQETKHD